MLKPNDYDQTQAFAEYEPLEKGGHICRIMKVEETESKTFKPMLKIYLDIAEGRQAGYYKKQYEDDARENKKWGCIVYQLMEDDNGGMSRGFKTFATSVEESNPGFSIQWSDNKEVFENCFKGKLIGGVFRNEQYEKQDGRLGWIVKCCAFRSIETIKRGVRVPEDKYIDNGNNAFSATGFTAMNASNDSLPF
jgi:hypothetical protein